MNTITLSFNGVDFRLIPDPQASDAPALSSKSKQITIMPDCQSGEYQGIKLSSFTGTLFISSSPSVSLNTPMVPEEGREQNLLPKNAAVVDEEPTTPLGKGTTSDTELPCGQTQLSFGTKKRSFADTDKGKGKRTPSKLKLKKRKKKPSSYLPKVETCEIIPTLGQATQLADLEDVDKKSSNGMESALKLTSDNKTQSQIESDADPVNEDDPSFQITNKSSTVENINTIQEFDDESMTEPEANELNENSVLPVPIKISDPNVPCSRWGQTMTVINDSKVLIYGGQTLDPETLTLKTLTDLHVYDTVKRTWSKPINCEGMPRMWHSATYLPERSLLISFGGEGYNPKTKRTVTTDQVMVLDTEIMLWYPPSVTGAVPTGRSGHTASLLPNSNELVIFGGVKNNKWQNSMAVLDTMRWKWSIPKIMGDAPRPRSYHSATAVNRPGKDGDLLVIFGGNNGDESFNSVHVLNATFEGKWQWFNPMIKGIAPSPRTGHTATLLEDNKTILIQGGWDPMADDDDDDESEGIFGDSFLLDTESWTWSPGPKPKFQRNQFGIPDQGHKRTGASSVLVPFEKSKQVLLFGGRVPGEEFASDFQTFPTPSKMLG